MKKKVEKLEQWDDRGTGGENGEKGTGGERSERGTEDESDKIVEKRVTGV